VLSVLRATRAVTAVAEHRKRGHVTSASFSSGLLRPFNDPSSSLSPTMSRATNTEQLEGNDDTGLMAAVAKQVQNTLQKKKKDGEAQFLASVKIELSQCAAVEVKEFEEVLNETNTIFDAFLRSYAASEDTLRALWNRLLTAHRAFQTKSDTLHATVREADKTREKGMVQGMAASKRAVEDAIRVVESLSLARRA